MADQARSHHPPRRRWHPWLLGDALRWRRHSSRPARRRPLWPGATIAARDPWQTGTGRNREGGRWTCWCTCGASTTVRRGNLISGCTSSCGCGVGAASVRHGEARGRGVSVEYAAWRTMRSRCSNPRASGYSTCRALGIEVCERWRNSFAAFLEDVGRKPRPEWSCGATTRPTISNRRIGPGFEAARGGT
jgi:hypothetical protein